VPARGADAGGARRVAGAAAERGAGGDVSLFCSLCNDLALEDEAYLLTSSLPSDCTTVCAGTGCARGTLDVAPGVLVPTGACCGSATQQLVSKRDCRVIWDGAYAGNEQTDCAARGSCCVGNVGITGVGSVCFNGLTAADCLLTLSNRSSAAFSLGSFCEPSLASCFLGAPPRLNSLSCCQFPGPSCTSDLFDFLCVPELNNGTFFKTSTCLPSGMCS